MADTSSGPPRRLSRAAAVALGLRDCPPKRCCWTDTPVAAGGEGPMMTEKVSSVSSMSMKTISRSEVDQAAVRELVKAARACGEDLTGPDGLLKSITATVLETALEEELAEHLGHVKHQELTTEGGNIRNGTRPKTVLTEAGGEVTIAVPRDRAGTFEPVIIKKRQWRRRMSKRSRPACRQGADHLGGQRLLRRGVRRQHQQGHDPRRFRIDRASGMG